MNGTRALGVDLGGTKLEVALVDEGGRVLDSIRMPTDVRGGPLAIERDIVRMATTLQSKAGCALAGIGVGIAGQIDGKTGVVRFSPNLEWHEVPLLADLQRLLDMPTAVTNDVRAITWGEWAHGAGQGLNDLICLYVGTGIGGGVVSGGNLLTGCSNTAAELGHVVVDMNGPPCTCGGTGCLESLAGGWAIARQAQQMIRENEEAGRALLAMVDGSIEMISAEIVARAASEGDDLSLALLKKVGTALTAGCVSLVNAFNPCRLILGGGVVDGVPQLVDEVQRGIKQFALPAAASALDVVQGKLGSSAGVIGAASLAMSLFGSKGEPTGR